MSAINDIISSDSAKIPLSGAIDIGPLALSSGLSATSISVGYTIDVGNKNQFIDVMSVNMVLGEANVISGSDFDSGDANFAGGKKCKIFNGKRSFAYGNALSVYGRHAAAFGSSNVAGKECNSTNDYENMQNAFATGVQTSALGAASFTTGDGTCASGQNSFAGGSKQIVQLSSWDVKADGTTENYTSRGDNYKYTYFGVASGEGAVSQGHAVKATGIHAHAEGGMYIEIAKSITEKEDDTALSTVTETGFKIKQHTLAAGNYSHAEGAGTYAAGVYSHAEGAMTSALAKCSHAEGFYSIAEGIHSFAEGQSVSALALNSHAEGTRTLASSSAITSHAEGADTVVEGQRAHAEGEYSKVGKQGYAAHAEGLSTYANGKASHAEGCETSAIGNYSHACGNKCLAAGENSFAIGNNVSALAGRSIALGCKAKADDNDVSAFVWNGKNEVDAYSSNGAGTFNINPEGGLNGLYVGDNPINDLIHEDGDNRYVALTGDQDIYGYKLFKDSLDVGENIEDVGNTSFAVGNSLTVGSYNFFYKGIDLSNDADHYRHALVYLTTEQPRYPYPFVVYNGERKKFKIIGNTVDVEDKATYNRLSAGSKTLEKIWKCDSDYNPKRDDYNQLSIDIGAGYQSKLDDVQLCVKSYLENAFSEDVVVKNYLTGETDKLNGQQITMVNDDKIPYLRCGKVLSVINNSVLCVEFNSTAVKYSDKIGLSTGGIKFNDFDFDDASLVFIDSPLLSGPANTSTYSSMNVGIENRVLRRGSFACGKQLTSEADFAFAFGRKGVAKDYATFLWAPANDNVISTDSPYTFNIGLKHFLSTAMSCTYQHDITIIGKDNKRERLYRYVWGCISSDNSLKAEFRNWLNS